MKVIEHQRGNFFLVKADNSYFLDVQCNRSFFSYSIAIQLTDAECTKFTTHGIPYIVKLAAAVNNGQDVYIKRRVDTEIEKQMYDAIMAWNAENPRD